MKQLHTAKVHPIKNYYKIIIKIFFNILVVRHIITVCENPICVTMLLNAHQSLYFIIVKPFLSFISHIFITYLTTAGKWDIKSQRYGIHTHLKTRWDINFLEFSEDLSMFADWIRKCTFSRVSVTQLAVINVCKGIW